MLSAKSAAGVKPFIVYDQLGLGQRGLLQHSQTKCMNDAISGTQLIEINLLCFQL